jgi:hypothetical protein
MSYRVLCDENVEPATVGELEALGTRAAHVNTEPGSGSDDEEIVDYARENGYVILTNDDDFLGDRFPGVKVLFYPDNDASAHEVAARVLEVQEYYPTPADLPDEYILATDLG